jgi:hypothetical protein
MSHGVMNRYSLLNTVAPRNPVKNLKTFHSKGEIFMADYRYLGLTAYIKGFGHKEVGVLVEAIDALQGSVKVDEAFDINDYHDIVQSDAYDHLMSQDYLCFIDDSELPQNTPGHYRKPVIEPVRAREIELTRIYIPTASKREDLDSYIHNAVKPVIEALFGENLICMKTKAGIEYENFEDGEETVLISVKDRVPQIA